MAIQISFKTDNAAFSELPLYEAACVLRTVADRIEKGSLVDHFPIRDFNGNTCGECHVNIKSEDL